MNDPKHPTDITATPGDPFLRVRREFDAGRALVFRAYTEPDLVAQWLGPRDLKMEVLEFDIRTGGGYRYVHRDDRGNEHRFRGVVHSVTGEERIIQTFEWEGAPGEVCLESVTFEDLGDRTRVHAQSVFPSVEARDTAVAGGMPRGITESMERLEELLGRLGGN
jgi:uncharacterized protein YndB with AHSA1/START domain